jgi:hypothetical protein
MALALKFRLLSIQGTSGMFETGWKVSVGLPDECTFLTAVGAGRILVGLSMYFPRAQLVSP